jgi:hypothetical protein
MRILVTGYTGWGDEVIGLDTGYFAASSSTGFLRKDVRDAVAP